MLFVRLDVNYQDDDKILDVTAEAELLYIRSLALVKRIGTDGYLFKSHLRRITDKLSTATADLCGELVDHGLWSPVDDGWQIDAWFKHNQPLDDVTERKRRGGKLGAHRRWKHKGKLDDCELCSDRTPDGIANGYPMGTGMGVDGSSRDRVEKSRPTPRARTREASPEPVDNPGGTATPDNPTPPAQRVLERIAGQAPPDVSERLTAGANGRHRQLIDGHLERGWATHALADTIGSRGWDNAHDPPKALTHRLQRIGDPPNTTPPPFNRNTLVADDPGHDVATRSAALDEIRATLTTDDQDQP